MRSQRPFDDEDVERLWHALRADVRRSVRCSSRADDVVQEAWLRTLETPPTREDGLSSWLRVVAHHFLVDDLRASRRRERRENEVARRELVDAPDSPHELDVSRLVDLLDEPYREAVRLRFVDECSVPQIAARLGRTDGVVRRQLKTGLERLRFKLEVRHGEPRARRAFGALPWIAWSTSVLDGIRAWCARSSAGARAALLALVLLVVSIPWALSYERASTPQAVAASFALVTESAHGPAERHADAFFAPRIVPTRVAAGANELVPQVMSPVEPPGSVVVAGTALDRLRTVPIEGARIRGAARDDDGVGELLAVTDAAGRFELSAAKLPLWVWAEHDDFTPTWRKRVPAGFERTGALVVIEMGRGAGGDDDGVLSAAALDHDAVVARERRDAFLLVERPPLGTGARRVDVRSRFDRGGRSRPARTLRSEDATASLRGRLAGAQVASGEPLQIRVESTRANDGRRVDVRADGQFEIDALPLEPCELWIEGGGLHGAWKAATISVDTAAGIDLGQIFLPPAAALRVQVRVPGSIEVPGPAGFVLSCDGVELRAHHRTLGAGITIDRRSRALAIERLWPGEYRLDLFGSRLADRTGAVEARAGETCELDVAMDPGIQTFVVARAPRDFGIEESIDVIFHAPDGSYRYDFPTALLVGAAQRTVRLNAGLPEDVVRIELVSSGGLHGEADLAYASRDQSRRIEFELSQR